ncbi:Hsp20/alpha crystallin family protein [Nocardioides sp. MAHUQ-72]|uniref:Hsp20/alpha crystallin family protein n=1 Tax=unclassified Nocardioides TaxID=2615069 RepID=UPI003611DED2
MSTVAVRASNRLADMLDWLESGVGLSPREGGHFIRVESFVDNGHGTIRAEIPGVDPTKDIELTVHDDVLTIRGERREEERDKEHSEFRYGAFARSVRLPQGTDPSAVTATYRDGILEVGFPTVSTSTGPTPIPVQRPES